jgi:hypothetical protein
LDHGDTTRKAFADLPWLKMEGTPAAIIFASYSDLVAGKGCKLWLVDLPLPQDLTEQVWLSFFNSTYQVGRACLLSGILQPSEVISRQTFLTRGLAAITALEIVLQSLVCEGFVLFMGVQVSFDSCPVEVQPLFDSLQAIKIVLLELPFTSKDVDVLRQKALLGSSHERVLSLQEKHCNSNALIIIDAIVLQLQQVANRMLLLDFYQRHISKVLELLGAEHIFAYEGQHDSTDNSTYRVPTAAQSKFLSLERVTISSSELATFLADDDEDEDEDEDEVVGGDIVLSAGTAADETASIAEEERGTEEQGAEGGQECGNFRGGGGGARGQGSGVGKGGGGSPTMRTLRGVQDEDGVSDYPPRSQEAHFSPRSQILLQINDTYFEKPEQPEQPEQQQQSAREEIRGSGLTVKVPASLSAVGAANGRSSGAGPAVDAVQPSTASTVPALVHEGRIKVPEEPPSPSFFAEFMASQAWLLGLGPEAPPPTGPQRDYLDPEQLRRLERRKEKERERLKREAEEREAEVRRQLQEEEER